MLVPCTGYQEARYTERARRSARFSCTKGAPSRIASSAVKTAGNSSYSTSINDSAHGGHRLADKAHLVDSKNMLVFDRVAVAPRWHVLGRDHALHAGMLLGLLEINAQDFPVRDGTAQNFSP